MSEFNKKIYINIKKIMETKKITTYSLARTGVIKRDNIKDKLSRLEKGKGISTTSLYEISKLLDVTVEKLIK